MQAVDFQESAVPWGDLVSANAITRLAIMAVRDLPPDRLRVTAQRACSMASQPDFSALAAAFELHQRSQGFDPVLTAADMRLLALYSQQAVAVMLLTQQPESPGARQWLEAGLSANRELLQLDPSASAHLHYKRGNLMVAGNRRSEAAAAYRSALDEASEHQCE